MKKHDSSVLITGATSDIGKEITKSLLRRGIPVLGQYHSARGEFSAETPGLTLCQADLSDLSQAEALVRRAAEIGPGFPILINMVGPFASENILTITPAEWRKTIELNLNVAFTVSHYAKQFLFQKGGHIINFCYAGVESVRRWPEAAAYAAAKAGLASLTKSLATALASEGVRVNAVCPGYIDFGKFSEEERTFLLKQIPSGRFGKVEEVVSVVDWLLFESPEYVTGAFIPVAGAWEPTA